MNARALLLSLVLTTAGAAVPVHAQDGPPDFAEMRQRMMDRMKEMIGANDDEWKAMQPKIEKIQQLQRDVYPRGMPMLFGPGPGGPGGPDGGPGGPPPGGAAGPGGGAVFAGPPPGFGPDGGNPSDVQQKLHDLRDAIQNKDTPADELKAKEQAYRDAKAAAKVELAKAQDDLKESVTKAPQEAALVSMGILE